MTLIPPKIAVTIAETTMMAIGFQLNGKTYNNHQYAKQTPIHKNTPSKNLEKELFVIKRAIFMTYANIILR